ncbi:MAG: DNA-directed RNA polymerase subunit beta' [bacterium]|nr:DNA-directed RNA polymerase subunit beta' [bacterium]
MFDLNKLHSIKISLASPEQIISWGKGEVTKPETINYRSQKPEPDGLFCEKIFGPSKDYECHCGRYKKSSYAGKVCEKCGVEVTLKAVRRERMGYIKLVSPCSHIWYVKGAPSKMGLVLGIPPKQLEEVIYFVSHIVINPGISKILKSRQVLDEKTAREVFAEVISNEILGIRVAEGTPDFARGEDIVKRITNRNQAFDFLTVSRYISRYLGSTFGIGAESVQKLLETIDLDKEIEIVSEELKSSTGDKNQKRIKAIKRLEVLKSFQSSGVKPQWMVLNVIPVIPPEIRPMMPLDGGRYATSDLNDLYRQVIIKNTRLKREYDEHAPTVILLNEKRMLQEAVDALIDNDRRNKPSTNINGNVLKSLSSFLKGKQGRFRQNLLGKRVDYSGRSVIAVGPTLNMDECGLPREMAIQLFRPFIAHYLMNHKDSQITSQKQADELIARKDPRVYDAIEEIAKNHPVLLNRAPTLHRLGIQAFKPILIEGKAIRLHPLVCPGFNADFDGDQMAVHVPLSRQAQAEAMSLMIANRNILKPSDGMPICVPSQDMIYGNYYLTLEDDAAMDEMYAKYYEKRNDTEMAEKFRSYIKYEGKVFTDPDTAILAYQNGLITLRTRIYVPGRSLKKSEFSEKQNNSYLLTTVGKIIFNRIFPNDFPYINFPHVGLKDDDKKAAEEANFFHTLDEFFVTAKEAYDAVIASGKFKEGDDFDAFKEYCKLQTLRVPIDKGGIKTMMDKVFHHYHENAEKTAAILDAFKNQGFDYCTKSGLTVSLDDMEPLEGRQELFDKADKKVAEIEQSYDLGFFTDEERHNTIVDMWNNLKKKDMGALLDKRMSSSPRNPMFMMMQSGARGSNDNYMQLIGMKGCPQKANGEAIEIPIKSCFSEGFSVSEYFSSTHGTRKNGSDTALKTADSGYLTRRLVDVSHNVVIREYDCGCDYGLVITELLNESGKVIASLYERLVGRFPMHDIFDPNTGNLIASKDCCIDESIASNIVKAGFKSVEIRSVLTCESEDGICVKCYGRNLATGKVAEIGDTVGIMAAQSIGEPGTQLTLKNFHTGGVAGQQDITSGLPRVQELLEVRHPKTKDLATITHIRGTVTDRKAVGSRYEFTVTNELESETYTSYQGAVPCVELGAVVKAGDPLTKGHIDPKELIECADLDTVRKYIINQVKFVYKDNASIAISDKHLEIIVRQMTNKILIINAGDTKFLPGQKVTDVQFTKENESYILHQEKPAVGRPIILGITKAALETDSFLSAASFQQTTTVLTDAAIKGKEDFLKGLKENVMVGKLIPAGTGIKPILSLDDEDDDSADDFVRKELINDNPVL